MRMRNARFLLAAVVLACGACASGTYVQSTCSGIFTSAPCVPAADIPVTMDKTVVQGCYFKGFVESHDAYASWSEAENQLRDQAVNEGGNVVLILAQAGAGEMHEHSGGEAFYCAPPSFTQPPASFVSASQMRSWILTGPYCPPPID